MRLTLPVGEADRRDEAEVRCMVVCDALADLRHHDHLDFASVAKTPGTKRCCLHDGNAGDGPSQRGSNKSRMYNW